MAKSFAHLPARTAAGKQDSTQDFFELLTAAPVAGVSPRPGGSGQEEPAVAVPSPAAGAASEGAAPPAAPTAPAARREGRRKATVVAGKGDESDKPPAARLLLPVADQPIPVVGVRQTFVIGSQHLERLRDYVHQRRTGGDYLYSQRQALEEALELLLASNPPAAPRPTQLRERERQLRDRIRQGRRTGRSASQPTPPAGE